MCLSYGQNNQNRQLLPGFGPVLFACSGIRAQKTNGSFYVFSVYHVKERKIRQYLADYCFNITNYLTMGMGGFYPRIATVTYGHSLPNNGQFFGK